MQGDKEYKDLPIRERVEILHRLCHWRMELDDIADLLRVHFAHPHHHTLSHPPHTTHPHCHTLATPSHFTVTLSHPPHTTHPHHHTPHCHILSHPPHTTHPHSTHPPHHTPHTTCSATPSLHTPSHTITTGITRLHVLMKFFNWWLGGFLHSTTVVKQQSNLLTVTVQHVQGVHPVTHTHTHTHTHRG